LRVEFKNKSLIQLYETGKSKKYRLRQDILTKFFMRIQQLEASNDIYDLWKTSSLHFEKMEHYENRYSVRLSRKWRLELEMEWADEEKTRGIVYVDEISKHYGD
jgi:proteic killer suppression protein